MKKIRIGIAQLTPGWQIILSQIGVNFRQLSKNSSVDPDEYSLLVVNSVEYNLELLQKWFEVGGAILWEADAYCQLNNLPLKRKRIKFIVPKAKFRYLGIIDFYCDFIYPCDNSLHFEDRKLSIAQKEGMFCLPFKLDDLILNTSVMRKRFYANRLELPSEQVSKVSKGKVRKIVQQLIEELHHQQNLPFVHKWFFPRDTQNVFIFRIDTDFCSKKDADEMYKICRKNGISATWFLDTDSDDRMTNYVSMNGQEMAIHCDKHFVYDNLEDNYNNILKADKKLKKCRINATGFAAPFGDWNPSLDKALQKLELKYSSEFALNYDDLPFYPNYNNKFSSVLQIPIHPISLGRLRRSHFNKNEMLQYFLGIIKEKAELKEPVIIYHHPHHKHFDIFDKIFQFVNSKDFGNMSMKEFSKWWERRAKLYPEFHYLNNKLLVEYDSEDVFIRISTKDGYTISKRGDIKINKISLKPHQEPIMKNNLKRIRKFHWRDVLYDVETVKGKKVFKK
jgi:hypothetical protein